MGRVSRAALDLVLQLGGAPELAVTLVLELLESATALKPTHWSWLTTSG